MNNTHVFTISHRQPNDPYTQRLLTDAKALGFKTLAGLEYQELYFIEGELNEIEKKRLINELFSDPVVQSGHWQEQNLSSEGQVVEIALRPGVTDPVAEQIVRGARLLGMNGVIRAATGQRFMINSSQPLPESELHTLVKRLLANPVIHHYALGKIENVFPVLEEASNAVEIISLRQLDDEQLLALSRERRAALDLPEMRAIQNYYRTIDRNPTDVEFETIAQTWSEHCSHKTFRADITIPGETNIHGLLKTYIRAATESIAAPWVWSAFVDNAGIIDFDDEYQISFKVETHNHPSAIEPFGGANTGLGGVIRDVLGVSAKPIAATDIFCFGPQDIDLKTLPEGTLHPRRIRSGVVAGVQDYGNKTGIPTVNGAIWYDTGYTANPLVFCGCVGLAPKNKHPRDPKPGDRVIVLGGRTGRDGLRGATFSSMTMDAQTGHVAGASVQIGDPIIAKGLIEVVTRARDLELYHAITDCGAGGFSSAVGEMASAIGAEIDLTHVKLKYQGLVPWEIWLSEAQERMVMAVPAKNLAALQQICDTFDIELTDIGEFTNSKELVIHYGDKTVLQLGNEFLFEGMPKKKLVAEISLGKITVDKIPLNKIPPNPPFSKGGAVDSEKILLSLLSHPNIASKESVIRRYDHEIQGGTVVKPLTGIQNDGPSDACVVKPQGTKGMRGIVLSNGLNPEFGKYDPYAMTLSVIDEAIRNAVAVGADPDRIAILDNFCWGNPNRPETLGSLVEAARGCYDGALHYQTPFISGKDSLNNEYLGVDGQRHAIPATLLISALGIIHDITHAVTMDFKKSGNQIYLLGETKTELVGSHFVLCGGQMENLGTVPKMPQHAPALYRALHQAIQHKLVRACHDLSEGGLAVAIAEMCIAGRLGCEINLASSDATTALFSESNGRLLVEINSEHCAKFEACFTGPLASLITKMGTVTTQPTLVISHISKPILSLPVEQLVQKWKYASNA